MTSSKVSKPCAQSNGDVGEENGDDDDSAGGRSEYAGIGRGKKKINNQLVGRHNGGEGERQ